MSKEMTSAPADALKQVAEKIKGIKRHFGSFTAYINDDLCLQIDSEIGWKTTYPFGTTTWAVLCSWIETWDDVSKASVENYIKGIVFPTSVRLIDIDDEYINDIITAHERLSDRVTAAMNGLGEENGEEGNLTLGEALLRTFGDGGDDAEGETEDDDDDDDE